jgi:glycosyltransferase involved in cell wall biosynthesis
MEPLISVIIPIYKVEEYLPRCLDSVVSQTYRNLEIILVDDGSPDGCGAICDRYAEKDSRIRVIHQENRGVAAARNAGLDLMTGEYLMFVDPDDWISPDAVGVLYDHMIRYGCDIVAGDMVAVWPDGTVENKKKKEQPTVLRSDQMLRYLRGRETIPCIVWGKLYRRSLFDNLRFPKLLRAEDVWVLPHIVERCTSISILPDVIYYYYQRGGSIVHTSGDREHLDSMRASLHVARVLYDHKLTENAGAYYYIAVKEGRLIREKDRVKQLLEASFTREERMQMSRKCYIHWRFILPDRVYLCLRRIKHLLLDGEWIR